MPRSCTLVEIASAIFWLAARTARCTAATSASLSGNASLPFVSMASATASMARREATSPAAWPPIPSATANRPRSALTRKESSFTSRRRPTSDTPKASRTMMVSAPS